jgi:hypothetical protein
MASSRHVTLAANVMAEVNLTTNAGAIEVLNRNGVAEVYFTTDNVDPVVEGNDTHVVPAAIGSVTVADETSGRNAVVKLISVGAAKVSVRAA